MAIRTRSSRSEIRVAAAAAGPSPRDPYRHALAMRLPQKVRPFSFLNYLRLCASATRGVPPTILTPRDVTAVRRAIVGTSSILRRQRAGSSNCPALAIPHPPAQLGPSDTNYDPTPDPEATAEAWSDWANYIQLGRRPGNGAPLRARAPSFFLPCERGLNSHTDVATRPHLSLAL